LSIVIKAAAGVTGAYFTRHLLNRRENDKVRVIACRGFAVTVCRKRSRIWKSWRGHAHEKLFYQFSMNPEPGERLTDEQYDRAEDIALSILG